MRRDAYIVVGIAALAACSSSNPSSDAPSANPNELTLEIVADECERLIGGVNAGRLHVEDVAAKATTAGRDELDERAKAHESVARAIGEAPYKTPDLQRLAGFYIGIQIGQASILRDLAAALRQKDEQAATAATQKFEQLGQQEDVVVEELNQQCRGRSGEEAPATNAAPSAPSPSAPPPAGTP